MRILIVKKDAQEMLALENQMSLLGHEVYSANSVEDGYQKYLQSSPELLISDISLDTLDGLELAKRVREYDELIEIILLIQKSEPEYLFASVEYDLKFLLEPLRAMCIEKILKSIDLKLQNRANASRDAKLLEEYKKVVDASSIVSKTDKKGVITFVNDEFCKISGYKREELIGKQHNIVRHPNMPKEAFKDLWETIKSKNIWKGVVENLKKDGGSYFVKATIVPILDESNNIVEFIGLREDITDLIEKEKEIERLGVQNLKSATDKAFSIKTSELLESIPTPLIAIDKDNQILQYNDEFHSLFSIDTANDFLTNLADNRANIKDIIDFEESEDELFDWKEEVMAFGEDYEVSFKHESSGRKFSLRVKEDKENNFIVAFA